ncbi:MAG: hypothetical protein GX960_00755 [Actinomycetales bacterium]|nr:hypothetical protein [Actinomycetales bacterium]
MAVRRPAPPRLQTGRPGATAPGPEPVRAAPAPALLGRRARRRALLLAGAAAAVGVPLTVVALRGGEAPFTDVAADGPGAEAMRWADETGVQPALSPTEYGADRAVTRGDVAVALHRLAGAPEVDLETAPALFTDLGDDPAERAALLWLHGRGALWGDAELKVRPADPATRDCAAMMLTALLRPALAGVGATWDATAEAGSDLPEVAWLAAAGMVPDSLSTTDWAGAAGMTRADLAASLHRADVVIADALG